ncbi:MAG: acyltransferase [Chloroflexota bacterium]
MVLTAVMRKWVLKARLARVRRAGLQIADDCRLSGWPIWGSEPYLISIAEHVAMADGVTFITHDGGTWVFRREPRYRDVIKYGRITIHENCVIGAGVMLLPGIEIGPNSVVAAGSVVTRSVPPNSVAGGSPARVFTTLEQYAEASLAAQRDYDVAAYRRDKRKELLRVFPRPW